MEIKIFGKSVNVWYIALVAVFLTAAIIVLSVYYPHRENFDKYKNVSAENLSDVSNSSSQTEKIINPINFGELKKVNADICGWIKIEGTSIDFPIMQSSNSKAEDYYLKHNWKGEYEKAGAAYIQKLNKSDFSDKNTIIYGHDMKNGSVFGTLKKYRDKKYFNEHKSLKIYTENHILEYEIYSAFVHNDNHLMYEYDFSSDAGYQNFINESLSPKTSTKNVAEGVSVTTADKIVTLSTCTSTEGERYLITAVLKKDMPI